MPCRHSLQAELPRRRPLRTLDSPLQKRRDRGRGRRRGRARSLRQRAFPTIWSHALRIRSPSGVGATAAGSVFQTCKILFSAKAALRRPRRRMNADPPAEALPPSPQAMAAEGEGGCTQTRPAPVVIPSGAEGSLLVPMLRGLPALASGGGGSGRPLPTLQPRRFAVPPHSTLLSACPEPVEGAGFRRTVFSSSTHPPIQSSTHPFFHHPASSIPHSPCIPPPPML